MPGHCSFDGVSSSGDLQMEAAYEPVNNTMMNKDEREMFALDLRSLVGSSLSGDLQIEAHVGLVYGIVLNIDCCRVSMLDEQSLL
jgi:hypothetical protein